METLLIVLLGGSLLTILGLIIVCSRLNTKNLELICENEILNNELFQYNIAAHKLLDKLENI
ncbi:putative membrane protein [Salmonella phage polluks]|uniref:Putative membrane protein n=1 Tax=Salmonella phage polluks TaxID=2713313 RepID=A0A6G8RGE5_9CAUD|nr:putative membrane protein [Salmonella phage polluks]